MYLDERLLFSSAQAVTSTGTHASTSVVENPIGKDVWGTAKNQDPGRGGGVFLHASINTAFTSASGLTSNMDIVLQDSPSETAASFSNKLMIADDKKVAGLALGDEWVVGIPADLNNYLRMAYVISGKVFTAGKLDSWISADPSSQKGVY